MQKYVIGLKAYYWQMIGQKAPQPSFRVSPIRSLSVTSGDRTSYSPVQTNNSEKCCFFWFFFVFYWASNSAVTVKSCWDIDNLSSHGVWKFPRIILGLGVTASFYGRWQTVRLGRAAGQLREKAVRKTSRFLLVTGDEGILAAWATC